MNVSDTLNLAADLIEERGWIQGNEGMRNYGPLCLQGAILAASGLRMSIVAHTPSNTCPAGMAVRSYLEMGPDVTIRESLWWWNDDRTRTATEVVEVLRATAVIESAREREAVEASA